jgi:hypothetical protein
MFSMYLMHIMYIVLSIDLLKFRAPALLLDIRFISYSLIFFIIPGNSAVQAISLLLKKGVQETNIIFLNLISVSLLKC